MSLWMMTMYQSISDSLARFTEMGATTSDQLLPLLHYVQSAHGCIPVEAMPDIAELLNISRAEVFGVVSFYDDFHVEPRGLVLEICGAEACQALGCRRLLAAARDTLGQRVQVKETFCLGNCAAGPSARIGSRVLSRATLQTIADELTLAEHNQ